jgi:hypothetical protein
MRTLSISKPQDAVPPSLLAVLELFADELKGVAFPGVDAALLAQQADEVRARARDVDRAQDVLDAALAALSDRTAVLATLASRGLAYARIYAADDPALAARLAEIEPEERPAASEPSGPRASLRRRRRTPEPPGLPLGEMPSAEESS